MALTLKEIEREISDLNTSEKSEILKHLITELDSPDDGGVEEAWRLEVNRRYAELENGTVDAVRGDEVMRKAMERLKDAG